MGLMDKINALSTGAKVGIASGAVLLAAAGVGLGVTQPWNQQNQLPVEPPPPVQQDVPREPVQQTEKKLSVRAGNDVVECNVYEGIGWSIYVPDGWSSEKVGENGARFSSGDGAQMEVQFLPGSDFSGNFVNLSADGANHVLQFYQGSGEGSPLVAGTGAVGQWGFYSKLFTALARTLDVGGQMPFGEVYVIPQPADWQKADGVTVLFLDKDGFVIDDKMQAAVEEYMKSWDEDTRRFYTGQYRLNDIQWAASYTGINDEDYIDVFKAGVQYRVAQGGEDALVQQDGGISVVDGWASGTDSLFLAVFHDGGIVDDAEGFFAADVQDWVSFASRVR